MDQQIYASREETLGTFLDWAGSANGATLLIPDLQRPYRWKPRQVVALIDSLLRGWPFGTLLVWDVGLVQTLETAEIIPARQFWAHVDRTSGEEGRTYARAVVPKHFRMVLDGQQRLQSLLLALTGDDSGFKLFDRDWIADESDGERTRASDHWAWGQLCLDVDRYVDAFDKADGEAARIDYQTGVFRWVVCNAAGGVSDKRKPAQTVPLPVLEVERFVRLSRLWSIAPSGAPNLQDVKRQVQALLGEHGFNPERAQAASDPLVSLAFWLGGLKTTKLTYLQVNPPPEGVEARGRYDEAVVNIFTRLNSGGTPLTTQEILFAWIKRKWDRTQTNGEDAYDCFEKLRVDLGTAGLAVEMDELVRGVAAVWSACANKGEMLGDAEFRRGQRMADVAPWLSARWAKISDVFRSVAKSVADKGLEKERHYESVNSVFALAAWVFVLREWASETKLKFREDERARHVEEQRLDAVVLHWMLVPQWAGVWQRATNFAEYVADLGRLRVELAAVHDLDAAAAAWGNAMDGWIDARRDGALAHLHTVHAAYRNTVRQYFPLLWAWQLLDADRAAVSRIALRVKSRASNSVHVDHIIPYDFWLTHIAPTLKDVDIDRLVDGPNALGNCMLLHANFNVSKQAQPLAELLASVHQFKQDPSLLARWTAALVLDDVHLDARGVPFDEVRAVIAERSKLIRDELAKFIRSEVELVTPSEVAEQPASGSPWVGTWNSESTEKHSADVERFAVELRHDGASIVGSYDGGTLTATTWGDQLVGEWVEASGRAGRFRWTLTDDRGGFEGTWGNGTWRRGRGTWRGKRAEGS